MSSRTFPFVTVSVDESLTLTLCDSTSSPMRTLGVHLSRAAAAQLADLLDQYVKPGTKAAAPSGMVAGALVGEPVDADAKAPTSIVRLGGRH